MKHVFVIFLLSFFVVLPVAAQDQYMVRNIAVDAEGANAIDAKDKALNRARRNGFETLVRRLNVDDTTLSVDDRSIAAMVNSFEINREKSSKNRYLASVNVMFNENAVQAYLGRNTNVAISHDVLNGMDYHGVPSEAQGHKNGYSQDKLSSSYKVEVAINGLSHLVNLKKSMVRIPMLNDLLLLSIRSNRAIIEIEYNGDAENLKTDLMRRGLQLLPNRMGMTSDVPYILVAYR